MPLRNSTITNKATISGVNNHDNLIVQNIYGSSNELSVQLLLNSLEESFNNLELKDAFSKIDNLISNKETSNFSKINYLTLKAKFYLKLHEKENFKNILDFISKNFKKKEYESNIKFLKLYYVSCSKEDTLNTLKFIFGVNKKELDFLKLKYLNGNAKEYKIFLLENDLKESMDYLILYLEEKIKEKDYDNVIMLSKKIISRIKTVSPFEQLNYLKKIISFFNLNFSILLDREFNKFQLYFIYLFEKFIWNKEVINVLWIKEIINEYINNKRISGKNKSEFLKLLKKYEQYLNPFNKIDLLILTNHGFKNPIETLISEKRNDEIVIIFNILFLERRLKYILQLYRKFKLNYIFEVNAISIFSKISLNRKLNQENYEILEAKKESTIFFKFYFLFYQFRNKLINELEMKKRLENLYNNSNLIFKMIFIRSCYYFDKKWTINFLFEEKDKTIFSYILEELKNDFEIDGIFYEEIISSISNIEKYNFSFEDIGDIYFSFKNPQKALYFFKLSWEKYKTLELAIKILNVLLFLKIYDEDIYLYLKDNLPNEEIILRISTEKLLSISNYSESVIKINKILLNLDLIKIKNIENYIPQLYMESLTNTHTDLIYENSIYTNKNKKYIAKLYTDYLKESNYEILGNHNFEILKLSKDQFLSPLNTFLLFKLMKKTKGFNKKHSGIRVGKFDENCPEKSLRLLKNMSGMSKFELEEKEYLSLNSKKPLNCICQNLYHLERLMKKISLSFKAEYFNQGKYSDNNISKLLSLNSILFLYYSDLLNDINFNDVYIQKSVIDLIEKEARKSEGTGIYFEILKILTNCSIKEIDDINVNSLSRKKNINNLEIGETDRIIYSCYTTKSIYITEDRNNILKQFNLSFSSLYLLFDIRIFSRLIYENKNFRKIINEIKKLTF